LVEDAGIFGRTARVPALWIYSENDHYIPAALGRRMFEACVASGAPARLQMLPPFGVEGHAEAKEEAMRRCAEAWKECSLYAAGQSLMHG
jgi:pimeloyl-ACP methyl ester carboxylesterase